MKPVTPLKISCRAVWKVFSPNPAQAQQIVAGGQPPAGTVVAVRNVSFDVHEGEIFVVMGLSGSGKSTLVRCISRLIEPTQGEILVDGQDVVKMTESQLRDLRRHQMSMVFQRFGLFPHRRVLDNVGYGLEVQGVGKSERLARSQEVLELVGLAGWGNYYPHELSGGMQQRVGLARALAVDPAILLCDEPFSALDPLIRREMQDELLRLQRIMHKTVVFITHDFLEALKLGDHVAIMKDGAVVQIGRPEEIVAHPANDYVREFTKDVPLVKVLTARMIVRPFTPAEEASFNHSAPIAADTKLEDLIPLTAASDAPLLVVGDDGQERLGVVDRTAVLWAMVPNGTAKP